ncbi:MAG: ankyrin repeat domain-containing protein [Acidobacteriota bacterium]
MVTSRFFGGLAAGALCLTVVVQASSYPTVADAVMQGDAAAVRAMLKDGADVNAAQGDGMTALHWAAKRGDAELTRMLLYAGANVKSTTRLGAFTPLILAAEGGHADVIAALLAAGADPNAATTTGTTPLMLSAAAGNARAVTMLIENGATVDAREHARQETPLMFAAAYNRVEAMQALIKAGADVKAQTKVVDLAALTSPEEEFFRQQLQQQQQGGQAGQGGPAAAPGGGQGGGRNPFGQGKPGIDRQFRFNELVAYQGGLSPLLFAARQGHIDAARVLLDAGADVNQVSGGDQTSPLLIAIMNGHFDLAKLLIERGADVNAAAHNGATPLYATLNVQWAPKALYPQPRAYLQQTLSHLDMLEILLAAGADPNARLKKKVWYSGYNFDLSGVDEIGATPFWRAAYAADVEAMKLLVRYGADPHIPTMKPAGRPRTGDGADRLTIQDVSGIPPIPVAGPGVTPLQAAAGVGYGEGFAANSHRHAPAGMLAAVEYLVTELGADVNAQDHEGNTALHHAAARGDNEMIKFLVAKGADVKKMNREGQNVADMANGPVQRIEPWPDTLKLLESLGVKHQNKCVSC